MELAQCVVAQNDVKDCGPNVVCGGCVHAAAHKPGPSFYLSGDEIMFGRDCRKWRGCPKGRGQAKCVRVKDGKDG